MGKSGPWRARYICCGREDGIERFDTWDEANAFRESYTSGVSVAGARIQRTHLGERPSPGGHHRL